MKWKKREIEIDAQIDDLLKERDDNRESLRQTRKCQILHLQQDERTGEETEIVGGQMLVDWIGINTVSSSNIDNNDEGEEEDEEEDSDDFEDAVIERVKGKVLETRDAVDRAGVDAEKKKADLFRFLCAKSTWAARKE